ncbi:glycosyltransferase family 39 protein [Cellulomonas sp. ATA003]|uniref:glycosyltransferase family 39 protein n=1 Tax=Cellulomonas sp. ATA003 TaxID=3073064 RepID=UPI002873CCDB|nr:glycosyltransferase family 39 protein [Cellulomonas sp. ATA003]WNB86050.1 glycosyltransferase family 39 protein [Cellulomonas sp. ATA003]
MPALLAASLVVVAALTARELRAGPTAQVLTALTVATGAVTVVLGHMLSTATTDALLSATVVWLAARALVRDDARWWLAVGLVGGVGLLNKHLVALLLVALVIGVAATPAVRHHLRSPWAWCGALVALVLWAPNLWWQASRGWPQLALAADITEEYGTAGQRLGFVLLLVVLLSPVATVLAVRGAARLWRVSALERARPVGVAAVVLVLVYAVTGGKAYYLAGVLPALVAVGADALVRTSTRAGVRRAGVVLALAGMVSWPAALPLLPASVYGGSVLHDVIEDGGEMIGWPELVAQVQDAVDRSGAVVVVTANYGQAGALEWYGTTVPVHSGHNGYADWGPPPDTLAGPVVLVGYRQVPSWLTGCRTVDTIDNGAGVDNEEQGAPVRVCDGPTEPWSTVWSQVRRLST